MCFDRIQCGSRKNIDINQKKPQRKFNNNNRLTIRRNDDKKGNNFIINDFNKSFGRDVFYERAHSSGGHTTV